MRAADPDRANATAPVELEPIARIAAMRVAYGTRGLAEGDLAATWLEQFRRWFAEADAAALPEPNAMVLATAGPDGAPSQRTVLLKGLDESGLVFFTHYTSRKGGELAANPRACALFPWHALHRQVIVEGRATPVADAESDAYWASRPWGSRIGALASAQSRVIDGRAPLEAERDRLAAAYPEGGPVPRPPTWGGLRLAPSVVEFWQGRPDRLHDRLRFRHTPDGWVVERLAP
jgi:pyridoxamine 5'-phosphate oxidase